MAQTIAEMMVEIGADITEFERNTNEVKKDMASMGTSISNIAKDMGQNVQGFSDKWSLMSQEMKDAYKQSQAVLKPFKQDLMEVEYQYFKMAQGMKDYKGTNQDFMKDVALLGKKHKSATEEMMKNNDFLKQSFIQTVGTILNRSGQSEKIAANFASMNNPLYSVNNGLLKVSGGLEAIARNGAPAVLALKQLGPNANMKDLQDRVRLINQGLMRFTTVAIVAAAASILLYKGLHKANMTMNPEYAAAYTDMISKIKKAFEPMIELFGQIMIPVYRFVTAIAELAIKFNEAHPVAAKFIQGIMMLIPILTLILAPLAIGIGLVNGFQGALGAVWLIIGPLVTGLATMMGTVLLVAGAIAVVGVALWALWTKTSWFKDAVITTWNTIKDAAIQVWNFLYASVIKPVVVAIVSFAKQNLDKLKNFWNQNGTEILTLVKNSFSAISAYIQMVMGVIKGIFEVAWPIISNIVKVAWGLIKTIINNAVDLILGIIRVAMNVLNGDWKGAWNAIKETASNIMNNIISFFKGIDLASIGRDIIQGLVNGLGSMIGAVKSKVAEIAKLIPDGVKDFLGIHSPSRVMMELGGYTGEGFVDGLLNQINNVSNAAESLSTSAVSGVNSDGYEYSSPSFSKDRIQPTYIIEMEGRTIARGILPFVTDEIRLKTGMKLA